VAYLGTPSNPFTPFVVGDGGGYIYLVSPTWYSPSASISPTPPAESFIPYTVINLNQQALGSFQCTGSVANLAVDPGGDYLYVGCINNNAQAIIGTNDSTVNFNSQYTLYALPIARNSNTPGFTLGQAQTLGKEYIWSGVSPVMRAYQAGFKGLGNTKYSNSGAVLVSGLVSTISNNTVKGGPGPVPTNSGVICSNGKCEAAYNVILETSSSFSVITAAEIGIDYSSSASTSSSSYHTSLYWNQVEGQMLKQGGFSVPSIPWSSTSNTIYSCDTSANRNLFSVATMGPISHTSAR
jgi:hypothetical protein